MKFSQPELVLMFAWQHQVFIIRQDVSSATRFLIIYAEYKYLVLPGKHKYQFWLGELHGKGSYRRLFDQEMELQLSAGCQYVVEEDDMVDELHFYDSCSSSVRNNKTEEISK